MIQGLHFYKEGQEQRKKVTLCFLCCLCHNFTARDVYWSLQLDEAKRQDLWNLKFHSPPLNVEPSIRIPSMFIDPVVDVFVDPCEPTYRQPSRREKEKFHHWTQRYSNLIFLPLKNRNHTVAKFKFFCPEMQLLLLPIFSPKKCFRTQF